MFLFKGIKSEHTMSIELSDEELKADIMNRLLRRNCWSVKYLPIDTLVNWIAKKVKPDGKRARKLIKQLINEGYLVLHKKGETVSLNSAKSEEITKYIKQFLKF
jgi:ketopantoate reductase